MIAAQASSTLAAGSLFNGVFATAISSAVMNDSPDARQRALTDLHALARPQRTARNWMTSLAGVVFVRHRKQIRELTAQIRRVRMPLQ